MSKFILLDQLFCIPCYSYTTLPSKIRYFRHNTQTAVGILCYPVDTFLTCFIQSVS